MLYVDMTKAAVKSGGEVYMSRDASGRFMEVSYDPPSDAPTRFLMTPCFVIDELPEYLQPICVTFVDPEQPDQVLRKFGDFSLIPDTDLTPQNPSTFDEDASFFAYRDKEDTFFPGYFQFESVSAPGTMMGANANSQLQLLGDTTDFRSNASFLISDFSTWRTYAKTLSPV